jgi:hypothetical protein
MSNWFNLCAVIHMGGDSSSLESSRLRTYLGLLLIRGNNVQ